MKRLKKFGVVVLGIELLAAGAAHGAFAAGCEDAYRAQIGAESGELAGIKDQVLLGSGTAVAANGTLLVMGAFSMPFGVFLVAPAVVASGFDAYLNVKRSSTEKALELLLEARDFEGKTLEKISQDLIKKGYSASTVDIAHAVNRLNDTQEFCQTQDYGTKIKLASLKKMIKAVIAEIEKQYQ